MTSALNRRLLLNGNKKLKYMKQLFFVFTLAFFISSSAVSQSDDYVKKYQLGKDLLKSGRYSAAMETFKIVISQDVNPYTNYSKYFYGLAAFKAGLYADASKMLRQLTIPSPSWSKTDDAYYLLANIAFEQNNASAALKLLQDKNSIADDADKMKNNYLVKEPVDSLKVFQKIYPNDAVIAKVLVKKLNSPVATEKGKMLQEYLMQEFNIEKEKQTEKKTQIKPSYNVAVLLPFMLDQWGTEKNNQFVLDMYDGIRIGVDSLRRKGVTIKLYAYDTEKEAQKVTDILKQPELASMDLIIGPIYPAHYTLVNEFGLANQITVINPLSTNGKLLENNEFVFLFQPLLQTQCERAAEYAAATFEKVGTVPKDKPNLKPSDKTNVIILYDTEVKDSLLAWQYSESIKAKGFNVTTFEKVDKTKGARIQAIFKDSVMLTTVHHIFGAATDVAVAANIVSSLEISQQDIPVITISDWLNFKLLSFEQLERRRVHFIQPDFIDYENAIVKNFKKKYTETRNIFPTSYAYEGFDLICFFGGIMGKYGTYFKPQLSALGFVRGKTLAGFDYTESNSNLFVPLTKFDDGILKVVNYPSGK